MAHQSFQWIAEISRQDLTSGVFNVKNSARANSYVVDGIDEETELSSREGVTFTTSLYGANYGRGSTIFVGSTVLKLLSLVTLHSVMNLRSGLCISLTLNP